MRVKTLYLFGAAFLASGFGARVDAADQEGFSIKYGVMERVGTDVDNLRETKDVTLDPDRRPGWCFLVDPAQRARPYDVYSVTYLPGMPRRLTGDFKNQDPSARGFKSATKRGSGIRPFCFDFDAGDPVGEYTVDVFVDGKLVNTLRLNVMAMPPPKK